MASDERPRVLVVDDSAFMRSRIIRQLERAGLAVVGEARNGEEAASLYAELLPDLVTMDLTMRGHDGLAGTRAIRAIDPEAKVVLFTIIEDGEMVEQAMETGVKACIHKSRPQELLECLRKLSEKSA